MGSKMRVKCVALVGIAGAILFLGAAVALPLILPGQEASSGWVLEVAGVVMTPFNITSEELYDLPTVNARLQCVDDPLGLFARTSNWTGVPLSYFLDAAGLRPEAVKVAFFATDGYSTVLALSDALRPDVLIAHHENTHSIPRPLGTPPETPSIRLVVPGQWGYKWIKWITRIEVVDYNYLGTYEGRGYPDNATIPT